MFPLRILLLASAATGLAVGLGPVAIEEQMAGFHLQVQERQSAKDWEGALDLIQQMADLDADHPRPYIDLILQQWGRGELSAAPELMDRLGLTEGPGRVYAEGMLAWFGGFPDQAVASFSEALAVYQAERHLAGQSAGHTALGNTHWWARRFETAVAEFQAAIPLLEEIGDTRGLADVLGNLAGVARQRGDVTEALEHQRRVLALRVELGDREGQALSWAEIGSGLSQQGERKQAIAALENAIALYHDLGIRSGEISAMQKLARVRFEDGDAEGAALQLQAALDVANPLRDPNPATEVMRQLGETYVEMGRAREGVRLLEKAVSRFRDSDDAPQEVASRISLGRAFSRLGNLAEARRNVVRALAEAGELDDTVLVADASTELGNLHQAGGDIAQALLLQERALELHRRLEDRDGERINLHNLGDLYFSLGDFRRSRDYIEHALRLARSLHDGRATALALNTLGVLRSELGEPEPARQELEQAIRIWESLNAPRDAALARVNLAEVLVRVGQVDAAAEHLTTALSAYREAEDRAGEAIVLNHWGSFQLAAADPDAAAVAHRQALELAEEHGFFRQQWRAHAGLSAALRKMGRTEEALNQALAVLDQIEDARARLEIDALKTRFLSRKVRHYENALALLMESGGPEQASRSFQVAERARARGLVDLLAESGAPLRAEMDPHLRERERKQLDRLSQLSAELSTAADAGARARARRRLESAEDKLTRLELRIRRAAPRYGEVAYPRPASLQEIQEVLAEGETLLSYFLGERNAWLWVVQRHGVQLVPLPAASTLEDDVAAFLEAIDSAVSALTGGSAAEAVAGRIGESILPPALRAGDRLIVVPDGALHHLPFGVLRDDGRYLIEEHEIAVIPSATTLRIMRQGEPRPQGEEFLGIADPIAASGTGRLPYSTQEVEGIAGLFPEPHRTVLTGETATESDLYALDLQRYRFLHFATHGWLDEGLRHSGLRLSSTDDPGTGLLSVEEILALDLSAQVVVLSACRSGAGEVLRGEGLVGLTRAFLYAGADAVVVSLWNVGDQSTTDFMQSFYERLVAGDSPAAALQAAKRGFLASDRPARHQVRRWAPFILVGNPGYAEETVNRAAVGPSGS